MRSKNSNLHIPKKSQDSKVSQYEISTYNENIEKKIRRLQQDNDLLKKVVEENQSQIVTLNIIKREAIKMNEELRDLQNKFFYALKKIHKSKSDQMKLSMQVRDM
jgi:hypothetical protein